MRKKRGSLTSPEPQQTLMPEREMRRRTGLAGVVAWQRGDCAINHGATINRNETDNEERVQKKHNEEQKGHKTKKKRTKS